MPFLLTVDAHKTRRRLPRVDRLVGGMSGQRLVRVRIDGPKVVSEETLLQRMGRIRDVQQGPDGLIYAAVDGDARGFDGKPTPIVRLVPVERR